MSLLGYLKNVLGGSEFVFGGKVGPGAKQYIWNWEGGGYHTGYATSLAEAKRLARWMGKPSDGSTCTLVPENVRLAEPGEIDSYSSLYD